MNEIPDKEKRIVVGITHGDINGINYEIIMKALMDQRIIELFTPVVYGTAKVASYYRKTLNINEFSFNIIRKADQAHTRKPNMVNLIDQEVKIDLGVSTVTAGELSYMALEAAVEDLKNGSIDVLVTAPINKKNIQEAGFHFPGHTEYLADRFSSDNYLMLMVTQNLRIGVVTGHIPLREVPDQISVERILRKLQVLNASLKEDFGINKPKIAVLGLNPHAGEQGLLGSEENEIIIPALEKAREQDMLVYGPFPADGFFGFNDYLRYDGVLAMYHDQGMIPFKTLSYQEGVNYTAGLPFIRTSPAHGTAYELAGKDIASPDSLRQAIYLALDIFKTRKMNRELKENALHITVQDYGTET